VAAGPTRNFMSLVGSGFRFPAQRIASRGFVSDIFALFHHGWDCLLTTPFGVSSHVKPGTNALPDRQLGRYFSHR
jgi:hypothetical protein